MMPELMEVHMCFSLVELFKGKTLYLLLLSLLVISSASFAATPPEQPSTGPGGADYSHEVVVNTYYRVGTLSYCIFEPDNPKPDTAPVILFIAGHIQYLAKPDFYDVWIKHLVRKGNIVIFPLHRPTVFLIFSLYTEQIIRTTQAAIKELQTADHVRADFNKFAIVGHSTGALLGPNISAVAERYNLPRPKAIMAIACPSIFLNNQWKIVPTEEILEDLSTIPEDTLILTVVGDLDYAAKDDGGKAIYNALPQIPPENKDYITVVSDDHGSPPLSAIHLAACSKSSVNCYSPFCANALDYYGYFKLFDGLTDAAFFGRNREYALGNTPQQRFMGMWSDGVPVKELVVTDNP